MTAAYDLVRLDPPAAGESPALVLVPHGWTLPVPPAPGGVALALRPGAAAWRPATLRGAGTSAVQLTLDGRTADRNAFMRNGRNLRRLHGEIRAAGGPDIREPADDRKVPEIMRALAQWAAEGLSRDLGCAANPAYGGPGDAITIHLSAFPNRRPRRRARTHDAWLRGATPYPGQAPTSRSPA